VGLVRLQPGLRIGLVFDLLRAAIVTGALAAFTAIAWRETKNLAVAVAAAAAIGLSPLFPPTVAPPWEAAAFGVCALGVWLARSARAVCRHRSRGGPLMALAL